MSDPLQVPVPAADQELRFERLLADLSADFVNLEAEAVLSHIEGALEQIVRFFGVDRSSFFEFVDAEGRAEILASWAMPGVESSPPGRSRCSSPGTRDRSGGGRRSFCRAFPKGFRSRPSPSGATWPGPG